MPVRRTEGLPNSLAKVLTPFCAKPPVFHLRNIEKNCSPFCSCRRLYLAAIPGLMADQFGKAGGCDERAKVAMAGWLQRRTRNAGQHFRPDAIKHDAATQS